MLYRCTWQMMSYANQLDAKETLVRELFEANEFPWQEVAEPILIEYELSSYGISRFWHNDISIFKQFDSQKISTIINMFLMRAEKR